MKRFKNKNVIITGSTRGIGLAVAGAFLREGACVTVFCRHREHGNEAGQKFSDFGDGVLVTAGDVRRENDVQRIVQETKDTFGSVDILINNAGVSWWKPIEEHTEEEYDATLDTNLKGAWLFSRAVVPLMREQGYGRIIMTSSGLGLAGDKNYTAYSPSKFGMIGLQQSLEAELAGEFDFHAYSVCPGAVATKLHLDAHPWENAEDMMQPADIAPYFLDAAADDGVNPYQCVEAFEPY